jgi:hypothetical protein
MLMVGLTAMGKRGKHVNSLQHPISSASLSVSLAQVHICG